MIIISKTFFSNGSANQMGQEAAYAECFARELKSLSVVRYKFLHKLFKLILKYLHSAFNLIENSSDSEIQT